MFILYRLPYPPSNIPIEIAVVCRSDWPGLYYFCQPTELILGFCLFHKFPFYSPRLVSSFSTPTSIYSPLSPFMGPFSVTFRSVKFHWYNNLLKLLLVWTRERVPLKVCGLTSFVYPIPPRRPSESKSCMREVGG